MTLRDHLQKMILGQPYAVDRFANAISRGERLARESECPRSVILLLGPTGVGKTEISLATGRFLYGSDLQDHEKTYAGVFRVDMGEFSQPDSVERLLSPIKSPLAAGFKAMKSRKSFIFHFDEIEKVHPDVLKLFLAINDAARITLADGTKLDFSECHLVYTSNLGCRDVAATDELPYDSIEKNVLRAVAEAFSPEQLQRFRDKIVFTGLDYNTQQVLCRRWVNKELSIQGAHLGRVIRASEQVVAFLIDKGYNKQYGARNMRNVVRSMIGDALLPLPSIADDSDVLSSLTVLEVSSDYDCLIPRAGSYEDLYPSQACVQAA